MEIDGYVYSQSQLRALVDGVQHVERGVSDVGSQYKTTMGDIRVAIGSDEYGEAYWKSRSERLAAIDAGLALLKQALGDQEVRLTTANAGYRAGEDASTVRS
ncbi:hypothetical protein ABGB18_32885 [Nonomuraea sp. B12E4]|uniref:hypothetical protein n=1 Tax=Nonomuraea sp. B12E4 TaxID=3153564 RepID=UPI00325DE13A